MSDNLQISKEFGPQEAGKQVDNQQTSASKLDRIKTVFLGLDYNQRLMGTSEYDDLYFGLNDDELQRFQAWQIEQAAKRAPNLMQFLAETGKDSAGNYVCSEERSKTFREILGTYGFSESGFNTEEIKVGVDKARHLVESGQASSYLSSLPFLGEQEFKTLIGASRASRVTFTGHMYVAPDQITGSMGHDSWAGRGQNGRGEVAHREKPIRRTSIQQIEDYATRDSQLPKLDFLALDLILTKEGPIIYTENAHRVSAAKLRNEPLSFSSISIYDSR